MDHRPFPAPDSPAAAPASSVVPDPTAGGGFGRLAVALATPFGPDGALDADGAQRLAVRLADQGCDALVLNGTTGESPTTTDAEKDRLVRAVVAAVGTRVRVVAGVGGNDTRHTVELARAAEESGAHGLLAVVPYYSRPPQEGVRRHFTAVADATGLPVMLYDIPARTGIRLDRDTLALLAEHPRITAVKDSTGDLAHCAAVIAATGLRYYAGDDALTLPLLAVGGSGVVSTAANVAAAPVRALLDAFAAGDTAGALRLHQRLLPLAESMISAAPGAASAKALLRALGLPAGPVRLPLVDAEPDTVALLLRALDRADRTHTGRTHTDQTRAGRTRADRTPADQTRGDDVTAGQASGGSR